MMNKDRWTRILLFDNMTLAEALFIIDDAETNGFEFKVENHEIYYREKD